MVHPGRRAVLERVDEHALRTPGLVAVAPGRAAKSACQAQLEPVRGAVDATVKAAGGDEGLQQQLMAKALAPVRGHAAREQREHTRADVGMAALGQDQKAAVVGDELEAVELRAKIPADPAVAYTALERGGRQADLGQPPPTPSGYIPQRLADPRQGAEVVMRRHLGLIARAFVMLDRAHDDLGENGRGLWRGRCHGPFSTSVCRAGPDGRLNPLDGLK